MTFATGLKAQRTQAAAQFDNGFPDNAEVTIDPNGKPFLKQTLRKSQPEGLASFEAEVHSRMGERHLLDILKNGTCWTSYTRHFRPPFGANPKLSNAEQRYILTVYSYGCNLGPGPTARLTSDIATAEALRRMC